MESRIKERQRHIWSKREKEKVADRERNKDRENQDKWWCLWTIKEDKEGHKEKETEIWYKKGR